MNKIIQIYKLLLPYLWHSPKIKIATLLTFVLIAIDIIAATYFPYIWKNIVAANIQTTHSTWFVWTAILLFIVWLVKKSTPHFREIVFFTITNQAIKEIRLKTIIKTHTLSLIDLEKYNIQEIISATARVSQSIRQFMRVSFISIFPNISKVISLSIALISTDIICFGIIGATYTGLIITAFCLQYYTKAKTKGWHLTDNVTVAMGHSLHNTTSIRFNLPEETRHLGMLFDLEAKAWEKHNFILYLLHLVQDFIFYIGSGIVFCLIIMDYANDLITLDKLVLIYGLIASMYNPLLEITRNMTRFFGGIVDLNKTLNILSLPSENKPIKLGDSAPGSIRLKDVAFAYPNKQPILKGIDLTIHPGDKIGIFGVSGAGKSTLCQIIAGVVAADSGTAKYGDHPIADIQHESFSNVLCYLPQNCISRDFDVQEHEHGIHLRKHSMSVGEHQRYLLNKALQRKPQILILDETTNALDRGSVDQALETILSTVSTVIMVSHRKTTIDKMQRIFELKNGHLYQIHPHLDQDAG